MMEGNPSLKNRGHSIICSGGEPMIQQRILMGERDTPKPFIPTMHMVIMAGQRISALSVDAWGPLQALEFTRLLDEISDREEREEMNLQWPEK
jgi:hypothetical protein